MNRKQEIIVIQLMPSIFKTLVFALPTTFSFLAFSKVAYAANDIFTLTWEQWYLLNEITEEVIIPIGKSLVPAVKDAGSLALEKSEEALEFVKNSFDNFTKPVLRTKS